MAHCAWLGFRENKIVKGEEDTRDQGWRMSGENNQGWEKHKRSRVEIEWTKLTKVGDEFFFFFWKKKRK